MHFKCLVRQRSSLRRKSCCICEVCRGSDEMSSQRNYRLTLRLRFEAKQLQLARRTYCSTTANTCGFLYRPVRSNVLPAILCAKSPDLHLLHVGGPFACRPATPTKQTEISPSLALRSTSVATTSMKTFLRLLALQE